MAAVGTPPIPDRRVFRIFISYASEDLAIATAVATCFRTALPDFFAEISLDRDFLEPGSAFKAQIEARLCVTDVLVIIYSGAEKLSHSYTGWEVGYFDHVMQTDPSSRKKVSLYLFRPPETTASEQGIPLGLSKDQLRKSFEEFQSEISVSPEDPLCRQIESWQQLIADNMETMRFPRPHYKPEQQPERCVRNLKLAIFEYLKTTVEKVVKPQKQITIRVKGSALEQSNGTLPPEAEIRPLGPLTSGLSMDIFGLSDESITWATFVESTSGRPFGESWQTAISTVILSSFPDRVDADNSQVIVAGNGETSYRVILTTATKFYDDFREYNLYFVETLRRDEYGDTSTTVLLRGLELVCRFRSAFLETSSYFLAENVGLISLEQLPILAGKLSKELNLLHRDSQEAGLNRPGALAGYVAFDHIRIITDAFRPCEAKLRDIIARITSARGQTNVLEPLRNEMANALMSMQKVVRPENSLLLHQMAKRLDQIIEQQDTAGASTQPASANEHP